MAKFQLHTTLGVVGCSTLIAIHEILRTRAHALAALVVKGGMDIGYSGLFEIEMNKAGQEEEWLAPF